MKEHFQFTNLGALNMLYFGDCTLQLYSSAFHVTAFSDCLKLGAGPTTLPLHHRQSCLWACISSWDTSSSAWFVLPASWSKCRVQPQLVHALERWGSLMNASCLTGQLSPVRLKTLHQLVSAQLTPPRPPRSRLKNEYGLL